MCASLYYPSQFNYICYEASSGGLSVPESDQRISYYGIGAFPTLKFDGYTTIEGAGSGAVDGSEYIPVIDNHLLNTTPVEVRIEDFSYTPGSASVDVSVTLHGELATIANTKIRVALVENNITYGGHDYYDRVLRDMFPDAAGTALTIQHDGQVQNVHLPFTMNSEWDPLDLLLIAWVQRDSDKFIYNSSSSAVMPYLAVATVAGAQQAISANSNPIEFGNTTITNVGTNPDTYDLTLNTSQLPAGWTAFFTHNGVQGTTATVSLNPGQSTSLFCTVDPNSNATGRVAVDIYSHGLGELLDSVTFIAIGAPGQVLLVADDGATDYATQYVLPSILADSRTVTVWDRAFSAVDAASLNLFNGVVWVCGSENRGIEASDRTAIDAFIAADKSILITGQDVAADLAYESTAAYNWFKATTHCRYVSGDSNNDLVNGVAGDPVGDGLAVVLNGGDGANNQTDADVINTYDALCIPAFRYGSGTLAGAHCEDGYKLVFLAFGLEGISTQAGRDAVMASSLFWLLGDSGSTPVEGDAPAALTLAQNTPNPFNPLTKIAFSLAQPGPVQLAVYDLQGRLVRTLASETMTAGDHTLLWDGRTDAGHQAASGTYVYRLSADGTTLSHKMSLLK